LAGADVRDRKPRPSSVSEIPLPEVFDAVLDRDGVLRVVQDIAACAEILSVGVKRGARDHSDEAPVSLSAAVELLLAGQANGVQVLYRHQGRAWRDTLLRTGEAYRLVRITV
jgi:hypothetical protein